MPVSPEAGPGASRPTDPFARFSASPQELRQLVLAERAGNPFLAVRAADGALTLRELGAGRDRLSIGRRSTADIAITWDAEVSSLHGQLECVGGEWTVVDDGLSTNGTFVNEQRVDGRRRLRSGDRIRVGRTVLAFTDSATGLVAETAAAGARTTFDDLTPSQRRVAMALCRPYRETGSVAAPASNQQIADEVFLSVDAVKLHLRAMFVKFGLNDLPQNQKRAKLAQLLLQFGFGTRSGQS